jgi:putative oxidoreductase
MVLAGAFHAARHELRVLPANLVLGAVAAFVAWGRLRKSPIAPRANA